MRGLGAIDTSDSMLALARTRCAGLDQVALENADASKLPCANEALDFAGALQVYCYVKGLDDALTELRRVVKPGGRVVILDSDFSGVVWESTNRERMRRVLNAYDGHVAWPDLPRVLPRQLRRAGFELARCEAIPFVTLNYQPNTYVFGLARFIHQFVVENAGVAADEADGWLAEFDTLEQQRAFFFAMDRYMFVATRR